MVKYDKKPSQETSAEKEKIPNSLSHALIVIVWHSKWRRIYILLLLLLMTAFAIWKSLPDQWKVQFLSINSEEKKIHSNVAEPTVVENAKRSKLIYIMESDANKKSMGQIVELLSDSEFVKKQLVEIRPAPVTKDYKIDQFLADEKPAIVIIHMSAFYSVTSYDRYENFVIDFIRNMYKRSRDTKFIVYSNAFSGTHGTLWLNRMKQTYGYKVYGDHVVPDYLGNVDTIYYPTVDKVTPEVPRELQEKVKALLKLS